MQSIVGCAGNPPSSPFSKGGPRGIRVLCQLYVAPSRIAGRGVFAAAAMRARRKLGEFTGERIRQAEARRRARRRRRIAIIETGDGYALDLSSGNALQYTNHSCAPNAFIRICRGRVELWLMRNVRRGEEITCDYGETQHNGTLKCRCGSACCRGYL